jgi:hypothetical protein
LREETGESGEGLPPVHVLPDTGPVLCQGHCADEMLLAEVNPLIFKEPVPPQINDANETDKPVITEDIPLLCGAKQSRLYACICSGTNTRHEICNVHQTGI